MWRSAILLIGLFSGSAMAADRVVVVTATAGFRHDSIETAERVIGEIALSSGFQVRYARTDAEAVELLSKESLGGTKLVLFVNTTGEIATRSREDLLRWVERGGSFIGVHSAADTWHDSPAYIEMLGGEFDRHPAQSAVDVVVDTKRHRATATLESPHTLTEEIYLFKNFTPKRVKMLLSLRASPDTKQAGFYPLAWYRNQGAGRVLYTALGHRIDVWTSPWFQQHLAGAIAWGLRRDGLPSRKATHR